MVEENRTVPRVTAALIALWIAWAISATALVVNQMVFGGSGIGPGPSMGIISLVIQAAILVGVSRRSRLARALTVVFLLLAVLPLQMIPRLIADGAYVSAAYTAAGFVLKAVGVGLLFTGEARTWFYGWHATEP
jgi:hypothetical protein